MKAPETEPFEPDSGVITWIQCPPCSGHGMLQIRAEREDGTYRVLQSVCKLCGGHGSVHPAVMVLWVDAGRPQ